MSPCCCWPSAVETTFGVVHNLRGAQIYRQPELKMANMHLQLMWHCGSLRIVVQCICGHAGMMQYPPQDDPALVSFRHFGQLVFVRRFRNSEHSQGLT